MAQGLLVVAAHLHLWPPHQPRRRGRDGALIAPTAAEGTNHWVALRFAFFSAGVDRLGLTASAVDAAVFPRVDLYGFVDERIMRAEDRAPATFAARAGFDSIAWHWSESMG